jgi:hypothetical protein
MLEFAETGCYITLLDNSMSDTSVAKGLFLKHILVE